MADEQIMQMAQALADAQDEVAALQAANQQLNANLLGAYKGQAQIQRQLAAMAAQLDTQNKELTLLRGGSGDASHAVVPLTKGADLPGEPKMEKAKP